MSTTSESFTIFEMTTKEQFTLPLFPLNVVLFPGMPLPLHIFEERYKLMINECVDSGRPFGVALIKSGTEAGGPAEPYPIGTSAIITRVERLADGRMDISTVGYQRFRILSLGYERPYLDGLVEYIPPRGEETAEAHAAADLLRPRLARYVQLMSQLTEIKLEITELPDKPVLLAFLAAILLQIPRKDKQTLLAAGTIPEMLARESMYLMREQQLLNANIGTEFVLDGGEYPFSAS